MHRLIKLECVYLPSGCHCDLGKKVLTLELGMEVFEC